MPLATPKLAISLAVLPLAISATYLVYLRRVVSTECTVSTGLRNKKKRTNTLSSAVRRPVTLPQEVASDESEWVLAHERVVSRPLAPSALPSYSLETDLSTVLTHYVRATMAAFSWTPQAFILRASAGDSAARETFDPAFIRRLDFREGDRVNGFWKVVYCGGSGPQGNERVEMALHAPPNYRGPVVRGVVVAGIEMRDDGNVVFVNETWMWRREGEAPVLLEGRMGQWLHEALSGWLVMKGIREVTEGKGKLE